MLRINVSIHADDPVVSSGIFAFLRQRPELRILDEDERSNRSVTVLCVDRIDESALAAIRRWRSDSTTRTVLIAGRVREAELYAAIECGVAAIVRRQEASPDRLVHAIQMADRGGGDLPPDLLGNLLNQVGRARRHGVAASAMVMPGFSEREADVIKLVADGLATPEIARKLSYSERTVKNILHDMMTRLSLRNRAHAVAYAAREGYL